jgi:hypothetical protein
LNKAGRLDEVSFTALYVPGADVDRIVSVADFDMGGGALIVAQQQCKLVTGDGKEWRGTLDIENGHYLLPAWTAAGMTDANNTSALAVTRRRARASETQVGMLPPMLTPQTLWHARLGHVSVNTLRELHKKGLVLGLQLGHKEDLDCSSCMRGKAVAKPYAKRGGKRSTENLEIVHIDMWGPTPEPSHEGFFHILTAVDDKSGITMLVGLESPAGAYDAFFDNIVARQIPHFLRMARKAGLPCGKAKVQVVQADYDTVFASERFREMCEFHDINLQFACPHSHGQNGVVERKQQCYLRQGRLRGPRANPWSGAERGLAPGLRA